jgi:hypothetical protein
MVEGNNDMSAGKKALAVVRCGDASLHESWSTDQSTVDLAISYFGDDAERQFPGATYVHRYKGGKWDGIYNFFVANPEAAGAYDYYWFPDDDVRMSPSDLRKLLEIGERHGLDLFQPALDQNSYYSHLITLRNSGFLLRYTNFVEIMAPMLSANLLNAVLVQMAETRSGFGLDFIWVRTAWGFAEHHARNTAIVDDVTMEHTRPVGGSLHVFLSKLGRRSANDELGDAIRKDGKNLARINGVATPRIRVLGALRRDATPMARWALPLRIAYDLAFGDRNRRRQPKVIQVIKHAMKAVASA